MSTRNSIFDPWLPLFLAVALWIPAMAAASYDWRFGAYYDYGWFVPPAALWLMMQRWQDAEEPVRPLPWRWLWPALLVLIPWLLGLRILGRVDPAWRLPVGLLGLTAVIGSHTLLAAYRGWRHSAGYVWITLLWCSALPWPSAVENGLVQWLSDQVVVGVAEVFQLAGRPVEILGDRLRLHDITVEVSDGCSGVRSFQSFFMATWFFAELQRLRVGQAAVLLAAACLVAFVVNMARAHMLATLRFDHGQRAFDQAHDWLGLVAFVVSALLFLVISGKLTSSDRRVLVRYRDPGGS
jgi:exosortase